MSDQSTSSASAPSSAPSSAPVAADAAAPVVTANSEAPAAPAAESAKPLEAKTPPPAAPKKPEPPRKLKLKVDKQDYELPEEEVIKLAQLGTASQKRFQEAAQTRKQAEDFMKMLREGDLEALMTNPAINRDPRKWAEEYLTKIIQRETLSPEQKKIQELQDKLKAGEDEKRQEAERKQAEEFEKLKQTAQEDFDKKFTVALSSFGLPKTPMTVKRMADYMSLAVQNGMEDIEPKDVAELVRQDYYREVQDLFGQTDGDALLQLLGDGVANKIRKSDLKRLKTPASVAQAEAPAAAAPPSKVQAAPEQPKKAMNTHEWREWMEKQRKV